MVRIEIELLQASGEPMRSLQRLHDGVSFLFQRGPIQLEGARIGQSGTLVVRVLDPCAPRGGLQPGPV